MKVIIEEPFLREIADHNKVPGKSLLPDEILKAFRKRLFQIRNSNNTVDLKKIGSMHFEKLKGKEYEGKYSIRLNISYRLIFRIEHEESDKVEIICIEEIYNHYS